MASEQSIRVLTDDGIRALIGPDKLVTVRANKALIHLATKAVASNAALLDNLDVPPPGAFASVEPLAERTPAQDHGEYRPASWFRKGASSWLRKAASPKRKNKHVRKRIDDGVVVYCVADVGKWRPNLLPKA